MTIEIKSIRTTADITKCEGESGGEKCPLRKDCHRFKSKEKPLQVYFRTPPIDKKTNQCKMYLPVSSDF
jgi:hypothetical protein